MIPGLTWPLQAALALVLFVAGAWTGIDWEEGQQAKREVRRLQVEDAARLAVRRQHRVAATGYEKDKVRIHTEFVPITQEVERVVEKPVYRDVCLDADGLRILSQAIDAAAGAGPEPDGAMPGPGQAE